MINLNNLAILMNDEIRESVHNMYAPCSDAKFLTEYLVKDPEFFLVLLENTSFEDWVADFVCLDWDRANGIWAYHIGKAEPIELTASEICLTDAMFELDESDNASPDFATAIHIIEALIEARLKEERL